MMPSLYRTAIVWAIVWPLVTVILVGIRATGLPLPLAVQTFLLSAIVVPLISFLVAPFAARRMAAWERRGAGRRIGR